MKGTDSFLTALLAKLISQGFHLYHNIEYVLKGQQN